MSPSATLDAGEAREASRRAADELFYRRGVAAVTMADIRDESGVSLRRLYSMYPSKSDLVSAWLHYRHGEWMAGFEAQVTSRLDAGDGPVDAVFSALELWMTETGFRGCGFINTHAEVGDLTEQHREVIRMHKRAVADYLETLTPIGPAIAVIMDGAIVQASIFESAEPIRIACRAASALTTGSPR